MKKKLLMTAVVAVILALAACLTVLFTTAFATNAKFTVVPSVELAQVDDELTVSLKVEDIDFDIYGFTAKLAWDNTKLQATKAAWGDMLKTSPATKSKTANTDLGGGELVLTAARAGANVFTDYDEDDEKDDTMTKGTIITVTFKVLEAAAAENPITLTIDSVGTDAENNHNGDVTIQNGIVKVEVATPTVPSVLFIADVAKGTGDGSSADNALGNTADYNTKLQNGTVTANEYKTGSAFYFAVMTMKEKGGTIVICDDLTIGSGDNAIPSAANYWAGFKDYAKGSDDCKFGPMTITSVYDGVDYRQSGAELIFSTKYQNMRFNTSFDSTWENLNIVREYSDSYKVFNFNMRGFKTLLGEGLVMSTSKNGVKDATPVAAALPCLTGGWLWNKTPLYEGYENAVEFEVLSGSYYDIYSTMNFPNGANNCEGNVKVTLGSNVTVNGNFHVTAAASPKANGGNVNGNVDITLNGPTMKVISLTTGYNSSNGSDASAFAGFANVNGNVNVTINEGTTFTYMYATPTGTTISDKTTVVNYGQIAGNCTITVNSGEKPISFTAIELGAQGFTTKAESKDAEAGVLTVKFNGTNWNGSYCFKSGTTYLPFYFFAGSGSNFVKTGGNRYSVLDFSGIKYDEYWAKTNHNSIDEDVAMNDGYATTATIEAKGPNGETRYGRQNLAYGANEVIAPSTKQLTALTVKTSGKTSYLKGEKFDPSSFVFEASFDDETTASVALDEITFSKGAEDALQTSDTTVTASYTFGNVTKTADIAITVELPTKVLTSITVTPFTKTEYFAGEKIDTTGLKVQAYYADESDADVTSAITLTPSASTVLATSDTKVTVSYTYLDVTKSEDIAITVKAPTLQSITPNVGDDVKKNYFFGEAIDYTGVTVTAHYDYAGADHELTPDEYTVVPADGSILDNTFTGIEFSFGGQTHFVPKMILTIMGFTFEEVTSVELDPETSITEYQIGDKVNLIGMTMKVNDKDIVITEDNLDEFTLLEPADGVITKDTTEIQIQFLGDQIAVLPITVVEESKKVLTESDIMFEHWAMWANMNKKSVTFVDAEGKEIITKSVATGGFVIAPEAPAKAGFKFVKWDTDLDHITADCTVKPVYEEIK